MKTKLIFILSFIGLLIALVSSYVYNVPQHPQPPVFDPASNPFVKGIYANGIVESDQASGANMNIYPEVAGTVRRVLVHEGDEVVSGAPLFMIDQILQGDAMRISKAQAEVATASVKTAGDSYAKLKAAWDQNHDFVSQDELDNAHNAVLVADANLQLAQRQYDMSLSLLEKYTVHAPTDGIIMALNAGVGSYVSSQGVYDTYTGGNDPIAIMGSPRSSLAVRVYVDEILVARMPSPDHLVAEMAIRGADVRVPLQFMRMQPYVSPKIDLSDERQERVDVRVLPLLFRFAADTKVPIYPGQLVDVYIKQQ